MTSKSQSNDFRTLIDGKDVFDYHILYATHSVASTSLLESQDARRFVGMSVAEYDALDGGHYWLANDPDDNRTFRCKADVLAYYRVSKRTDVVLQELQQRKLEKQRANAGTG